MAASVKAAVAPAVIRWARESYGLSVQDAAERLHVHPDRIAAWESGEDRPTIGQLRRASEVYRRPFGVFLLSEPPAEAQPLPHDFRRLPGEVPQPKSERLTYQLRLAAERRLQALELYEDLGERPEPFPVRARLGEDAERLGQAIREAVKVTVEEQAAWRTPEAALSAWKAKLESVGILVVQFSRVDVREMRGASVVEFPLPVIALNSKDSVAGRVFTLFHELAHISLGEASLCDIDEDHARPPQEQAVEVFCNTVAGAVLVPREAILGHRLVQAHHERLVEWSDEEIDALRRHFAVSRFVVLRRLVSLGRASDAYYARRHRAWAEELAQRETARADRDVYVPPPRKALSATGKEFARLVLRAYHEDHITLSDVSEYLRLKVRHLPELEREAFG
jgi:Zn-dependent peptidase ImmA (M78 family)